MKRIKYFVEHTPNRDGAKIDYWSWDVNLEVTDGYEFIAEFIYEKDAKLFAAMKNKEISK